MKRRIWLVMAFVLVLSTVSLAENVALYSEVESSSNYGGYNPSVVNDGERNYASEEGRWSEVAWASLDMPDDHWLEFWLPGKVNVKEIFIWWARDRGTFWYSEEIIIEADRKVVYDSTKSKDKYPLVKEVIRKQGVALVFQVTEIYFKEPVRTDTIRIIQPAGGGNPERPNIMWVAEVEIYE